MPSRGVRDPERLQALLEAVLAVGSDLDLPHVLRRVVEAACSLTGARYGALGVLDATGTGLAEFVTVGVSDETVAAIGHRPEGAGVLGTLILDPRPLRLAEISRHPDSVGFPPGHPAMHSFLGVPIRVGREVFGNLYLTEKQGAPEFTADDEAMILALAGAIGISVENARLHARIGQLGLAAERERIARDLHDTVIQRIFATGLALQSALPLAEPPEVRARIEEAIADLDDTIRQVRTTIFALEPPPTASHGLRARVLEVCAEAARGLGFDPAVSFTGPIDNRVDEAVAAEVLATLREALANVARHARAQHAEVSLSVGDEVHLRVTDDGCGPRSGPPSRAGRGVPDMAARAESLGGSFTLAARDGGGTELSWRVPLAPGVSRRAPAAVRSPAPGGHGRTPAARRRT